MVALERVNRSDGLLWYPLLMDAPCFERFKGHDTYRAVVRNYEARLANLRAALPDRPFVHGPARPHPRVNSTQPPGCPPPVEITATSASAT